MVAPAVFSSRFKVAFITRRKVSCHDLRDCFTRCASPQLSQLVAKCEQIYAWQVVSFMNEHGKPKFVAKADPLSTVRNNKLIAQGEKLETSANLSV